MNLARTYRYCTVLVTALFLLLQGASLSHAASYGSGPHEHDGILCVLSLQEDGEIAVPAPQITAAAPDLLNTSKPEYKITYISAPSRLYRGREPPPRAPPAK